MEGKGDFDAGYVTLTNSTKLMQFVFSENSVHLLIFPGGRFFFFFLFLIQYLSRGIQFSRASLNGALTKHKNKDIKILKLDN